MFGRLFKKTPCETFGHYWDADSVAQWDQREDHPGGPPGNDMMLNTYATHSRKCLRCEAQDTVIVLIDRTAAGDDT